MTAATAIPQIEELARTDDIDTLLTPMESALVHIPAVQIGQIALPRLTNGNPVEVLSTQAEFGDTVWAACRGQVHAIGAYRAGMFHPSRVLNRAP
jgi:tRNA pseudouridine55 synthase